jgi:hypothetical protein
MGAVRPESSGRERGSAFPPAPAAYSGGGRNGLRGGICVEAIRLLVFAPVATTPAPSVEAPNQVQATLAYFRTKGRMG